MRGTCILLALSLLVSVSVLPATAQTVTSIKPAVIGQAKARPYVRINLNGSYGDNRTIADGLAITISDDLYGRGTRTYEFNTSGGVNIGGAIEVVPPTAWIFDAFTELADVINSEPSTPFWAVYYYAPDIGNNGWFLLVWKYDDEYRLTSGPPFGPVASEAADPANDISISGNFSTNNNDNCPIYLQLQGTDLTLLDNLTSVKLRHDVQTGEVYDARLNVKHANAATAQIQLAAGSGSPPVFPSLGDYDLEINGIIVIDKAVRLVENLVDDQSFRVHASGGSFTLNWVVDNILISPYWRGTSPYTDTARKGALYKQQTPRIYPFPTGTSQNNSFGDNEHASLQWISSTNGTRELWQSHPVDFAVDTTLTLTGLWAASADHYGMLYGVQLRSGDKDGTIIAETPPGQQVINEFEWTEFAVSGRFPAGTTEVTVVFYGDYSAVGTGDKVLHIDDVLLRVDSDHPAPPSLTGMTSPDYAAIGDTDAAVTLTGVNLAGGQTSVYLQEPNITLANMSWADVGKDLVNTDEAFARYEWGAGDKIVLTSGTGVIPGEYDIASKDSDVAISLVDDINGGGGDISGGITGYIVKPALAASSVSASGAQVTATFDLTGAPAGYRNIVVEVGTHLPIVWREGFNVVQIGPELVNGSFELPASSQDCAGNRVETPTPASDWKARYWDGYMGTGSPILSFRDDEWGITGFPSCPAPELGIHYHSTAVYSSRGTAQYYQTVTAAPGGDYTLSGFFSNRSEGGASNSVTLELLDGDSSAAPMAGASVEVLAEAALGGTDWTFAYVSGTAAGGTITAAWQVECNGLSAPHVANADGLVLEECTAPVTVASVNPFAVANDAVQPVTLTITGSGFSGGTPEVLFTRRGHTLFGSNVIVLNDTTLTCQLSDLPTPETVAFDVVVRNNGCIDSLAEGFVSAQTTILNAGFEEPFAALNCLPRIPNLEPVSYWNHSDQLIREGDVFSPAECPLLSCNCPEPRIGCAGGHYATMSTGEGEEERAWQALKVEPGAGCIFGGWFSWGGTGTVNLKLVDGYGPDGTVLGITAVPQGNDWCYYTVEGFAPGHLVTVVWELVGTVNGSPAAVHADTMTLEFSTCHDPFADTDLDGDVDQDDLAFFQLCFTGPGGGIPAAPEYCACLDVEGVGGMPDGDIDQGDLGLFEDCASGPGIPADVACDD